MIVAGYSSYPRHYDYAKMREIADEVGALLMADVAHIAGLISAGLAPNPFPHCHVVTTTTHKTLRGPRGSLVFARRELPDGRKLFHEVNEATFPGFQGGPHNHTIGAIATALKEAAAPEFKIYQQAVLRNAKALGAELERRGVPAVTGGTDNHLVLVDLRPKNVNGSRAETLLNLVNISVNKNTVRGDLSALKPSGLRLGSPAMTTRAATDRDFELIAELVARTVDFAATFNRYKKASEFSEKAKQAVEKDSDLAEIKRKVIELSRRLPYNHLEI